MNRTLPMTDTLHAYLIANGLRETEAQRRLREETASHRMAKMQIAPEQGALLDFLVRLIGARRCIEVGTFTGYSALTVAQALPDDGELIACDLSEPFTEIARRHWQAAGVANRIQLHLQPALLTLDVLLAKGEANQFDFAFIDADKASYPHYYERCLQLVRPGGLIVLDNMLLGGRVAQDPAQDDTPSIDIVRRLTASLQQDPRIDCNLLPLGDGMTLCRKR